MRRLGKVSTYAKQGFLIIRSTFIPALNDRVIDKNLQVIGIVKDVFGPVKSPYVAIKPRIKNPEKYIGEVLYIDKRRNKKPSSASKKSKKIKKGAKHRPAPQKRG